MKTKHHLILIPLIVTLLSFGTGQAAVVPWTDNGVTWNTYYNPDTNANTNYFDKLPDAVSGTTPKWTVGSSAAPYSVTITSNYLTIDSSGAGSARSYRQTNGWDLSKDSTIEVRMKVDLMTGTDWAGDFLLASGAKFTQMTFSTTTLDPYGTGSVTGLNLTNWTVLRFTWTGGINSPTLKIYVNNNTNVALTVTDGFGSNPINYLQFGDGTTSAIQGGTVNYDYVRWTDAGAFAPIPEPHTLALLGLAGIALWAHRRRRHRSRS